ncbi:MAG: hypothetical protein GY743_23305 [Planctomycetaceae bacterium]|nr:hypothetical protein [Planctomycetaceae bacterium]
MTEQENPLTILRNITGEINLDLRFVQFKVDSIKKLMATDMDDKKKLKLIKNMMSEIEKRLEEYA